MIALNVISLCLGEIYSFVVIDMDLYYVMCLVLHLILIILLESIVRRFLMRAGWQHSSTGSLLESIEISDNSRHSMFHWYSEGSWGVK